GHGLIRRADDAGGQEQTFYIVAAIEFEGERDDLLHGEPRPLDIAGYPVDAIGAVEDAEVGHEDLQQRDAAPIRSIGVADAASARRADAALAGIAFLPAAGGT